MAAARPRATRSRSSETNCRVLARAQDGGEDGDLVEDGGDDGQAVTGDDLAAAVGAQPGVPVVHHFLQPQQGDDGAVDVGADEFVGDVIPQAEFDLLGVEQDQAVIGEQGGVGGHGVQQPGFAASGFARGEQVLVDQADVDGLAEFVAAHVDWVEHGQHRPDRDGAGGRCGAGHGGSPSRRREPQAGWAWGSAARVMSASQAARGSWLPGGRVAPVRAGSDPVGDVAAVAGSRGRR